MRGIFLLLLAAFAATAPVVYAEEHEALDRSDDPIRYYSRTLQVKPTYNHLDDGWSYTQTNRILLPDEGPSFPHNIFRLEFPFQYQNTQSGVMWGLQDFIALDLLGGHTSFGAIGLGPVLSMPTATNSSLGTGRWSAGPAFGITARTVPGYRLSLLVQQFFSFAGNNARPPVNTIWIQPVVAVYFNDNYGLLSDPIFKIDWYGKNTTLPVNLQLQRKVNPNLTVSLGPEYALNKAANWSIKLTVNYLNW